MGCDVRKSNVLDLEEFQSTHPRGVRLHTAKECHAWSYFNPRTHVGCDTLAAPLTLDFMLFQSTHPRGVRLTIFLIVLGLSNFNPRTHVGCDDCPVSYRYNKVISIHAPTWGATSATNSITTANTFQSTHPRGVRQFLRQMDVNEIKFQSTHPRGVRLLSHQMVGF